MVYECRLGLLIDMKALFANVLVLLYLAAAAVEVRAADVVVVMSSEAEIYREALEGFRETISHRIVGVQNLKDNLTTGRDEFKKLRATLKPEGIFAIGTPALQLVAAENPDVPIVHALVFNPFSALPSPGKNVTGVGMNPSANQVMSLIKELNPKMHRIGVLFDPSSSSQQFSQARLVAQKEGLQLVSREIRSSGEIAAALTSLENEIDALWLWPDERFLVDDVLQRIFLFSFERKIPVLGLSERHTQVGAVLSLSYASAKDMGRQAAAAANAIIAEKKSTVPAHIPLRQTKLTVNLKTARKLDVDVPESIISRADNAVKAPVYREGDWWVFRIKILSHSRSTLIQDHRVIYKNGNFNSEDPSFLAGGDEPSRPSIYPFPTVYFADPQRKWLDFPLLPGKTWSYRFLRTQFSRGPSAMQTYGYGTAVAEVMGQFPQMVQTAAGTFRAIEIQRQDSAIKDSSISRPTSLTYFYSPQTKSVIKSIAHSSYRFPVGYQFELELIAYGNEGDGK